MLPLHLRRGRLVLRLYCFEAIAFADVDDASIIGIDASLALRDVAEEERPVIRAKGEVLLVLTEHAAGEYLASLSVQWHFEAMLDR